MAALLSPVLGCCRGSVLLPGRNSTRSPRLTPTLLPGLPSHGLLAERCWGLPAGTEHPTPGAEPSGGRSGRWPSPSAPTQGCWDTGGAQVAPCTTSHTRVHGHGHGPMAPGTANPGPSTGRPPPPPNPGARPRHCPARPRGRGPFKAAAREGASGAFVTAPGHRAVTAPPHVDSQPARRREGAAAPPPSADWLPGARRPGRPACDWLSLCMRRGRGQARP